jgi:hypothetical protein
VGGTRAEVPAGRYYRPYSGPVPLMVFLLSVLGLLRSGSRPEVKEKFQMGKSLGWAELPVLTTRSSTPGRIWLQRLDFGGGGGLFKGGFFLNDP